MAGHSKWANIKHRKGRADAARARIFSRLGREIYVAARLGGPDPAMNPRLRLAIAAARGQSMPKDGIEKNIRKGVGNSEGADYEEIRYEGYAPGGVAVIVECLTDNRNRTAAEIRALFAKANGNMAETGAVGFLFERMGEMAFPAAVAGAEEMFDAALEAGAADVESDAALHTVRCAAADFAALRDALESRFGEPQRQGLIWQPNVTSEVDEDTARAVIRLLESLEDSDDVQTVTTNFEAADEIMEKILAED